MQVSGQLHAVAISLPSPRKEARGMGVPQSQSERFGEDKYSIFKIKQNISIHCMREMLS
jgi:hypothetical protein